MFSTLFAANALGGAGDVFVFFAFIAAVIFVAFFMSRGSGSGPEDYFLGGRSLNWFLIGFSLIAANISAEQMIGMSGQGADYIGLAVASYEWIAAVSLVLVAFFFLPKFLRAGIYTIPEYLQNRYNKASRTIMSIMMMVMLCVVNITVVTYAGAKAYAVFFDGAEVGGLALNLQFFCWVIGIIAAVYIFAGGLKACAYADLLQGSALIVAGAVVLYFALQKLGVADPSVLVGSLAVDQGTAQELTEKITSAGAWERFDLLNDSKLRMNLPSWDLILPCTALIFAIWIPNMYYWGINQYIIQRTLGAKTLGEGQKGLVFAAYMKLLIPFIVIFPGMIAFNLYHADMKNSALESSKDEIQRFESQKDAPTADLPLFSFNRSYAKDYPEKAQAILEYDAKAAGIEVPVIDNDKMEVADRLEQELGLLKKSPAVMTKCKFSESTISGCDPDRAFPLLMARVVPSGGFKGFMLAALLGAIVSSVAAMLNAASTIFTMDIYNEYCVNGPTKARAEAIAEQRRKFKKISKEDSDFYKKHQRKLVLIGRVAVVIFVLIGCIVAPIWANPKYRGVFTAIQEFQGYISPGIFAAFVVGFWMKKAPNCYGVIALLGCPILYAALAKFAPGIDFLNRMAVTFGVLIAIAVILRVVMPRKEAFAQPTPEHLTEEELDAKLVEALVEAGLPVERHEELKAFVDELVKNDQKIFRDQQAFEAKLAEKNFTLEQAVLLPQRKQATSTEKWSKFVCFSKGSVLFGLIVVVLTIMLYVHYWK